MNSTGQRNRQPSLNAEDALAAVALLPPTTGSVRSRRARLLGERGDLLAEFDETLAAASASLEERDRGSVLTPMCDVYWALLEAHTARLDGLEAELTALDPLTPEEELVLPWRLAWLEPVDLSSCAPTG